MAAALTDGSGIAAVNITVPWGNSVSAQATAGNATISGALTGTSNPATVSCLTWQNSQSVYRVSATVANGSTLLVGMPVTYLILSPSAMAGTISPAMTTTNGQGIATTFVGVPMASNLPVVVEATSGNSAWTTTLTADASGGGCR